jgi:hypothetical protein
VAFHEYAAMWRDVRAARGLRDRLGVVFRGPGWRPDQPGAGSVRLPAAVAAAPVGEPPTG